MSFARSPLYKFTEQDCELLEEMACSKGLKVKFDNTPNNQPCAYLFKVEVTNSSFCVTKSKAGWIVFNEGGWVLLNYKAEIESNFLWPE